MDIPNQFHFTHTRRVEFSDTDMAGIMHFASVFNFVESAEHAFFRSLGLSVHSASGNAREGWPRFEASCKYFKPARFEQMLETSLRIEEIRSSSMRYHFWIFGEGEPKDSPIAAGEFTIVYAALDTETGQIRKASIPENCRSRLQAVVAST